MPSNEARLQAVVKADATADLLQHVGWNEHVKPALLKQREQITKVLVASVLGSTPTGAASLTKEQLAGHIYGIDKIISTFEKILQDGHKALTDLESQGFHLTI